MPAATIERIGHLTSANGWFALYRDPEQKLNWVLPLACWGTIGYDEKDKDAAKEYGVVGLVAFTNPSTSGSLRLAQSAGYFVCYMDLFEAKAVISKALDEEGEQAPEETKARVGYQKPKGPMRTPDFG